MFEVIDRNEGRTYKVYNVIDRGEEGGTHFLIFKFGSFFVEPAMNFLPKDI